MEVERLLVVDNDEKICQILTLYLRSKGYEVMTCKNGSNALAAFSESKPDLMILDIDLPGMDGFEILASLRRFSNLPVIMLSERTGVNDMIRALELGADDYITKPFDSKELLARIRAVLRRSGGTDKPAPNANEITFADIVLYLNEHSMNVNGSTFKLPDREFELMSFFAQNRNKALTRSRIIDEVWGSANSDGRSLDVHIRRLRMKLKNSKYCSIETVWRIGYRLRIITKESEL